MGEVAQKPNGLSVSREEDDAVIEKARQILKRRVRRSAVLDSPNKSRDYFCLEVGDFEHEVFCVLFLDTQNRIIANEKMFRGTIDGASVYPREIVKACLRHNSSAVIFCHNHPSGVCEPSSADRRITERLTSALALIDVRVLDHLIVSGGDSYSFAESGLI
jgi:DNA repair protein RadC